MTIELHNNVYYEGEGIPVVLVHGFPVDHRMWNECADALKTTAAEHGMKQFPIWAPDMPGRLPDSRHSAFAPRSRRRTGIMRHEGCR